jgi:hypothetical protein
MSTPHLVAGLGGANECFISTNQGVYFKVTVDEKMLARVLKEIAHYEH